MYLLINQCNMCELVCIYKETNVICVNVCVSINKLNVICVNMHVSKNKPM